MGRWWRVRWHARRHARRPRVNGRPAAAGRANHQLHRHHAHGGSVVEHGWHGWHGWRGRHGRHGLEALCQRLQRGGTQGRDRHADGAQRRGHVAGDGDVIKADDGDVLGHAQTGFGQGGQAAHGHHVVGGEDGIGPPLGLHHLAASRPAGRLAEIAVEQGLGQALGGGRAQPGAVAPQPLLRFVVAVRPADEGDALAAERRQMPRHRLRTAEVVHLEAGVAGQIDAGVDQHGGQVVRQVGAQECRVRMRRHHQQPIDPAIHGPQCGGRLVGIAVGAADQQVQATRPRRLVNAADQLREVFAVQIGQQRADGVGAPGDQAAGRARGAETQVAGGSQDARLGVGQDVVGPVHGARHGGDRHAGSAGNVLDGGGHGARAPGIKVM